MSEYNKLSDIQYARFQILPVDLHFGLFWSAGIPTMFRKLYNLGAISAVGGNFLYVGMLIAWSSLHFLNMSDNVFCIFVGRVTKNHQETPELYCHNP